MKIKVFKFGGASVKDADSVRNVAKIIQSYPNQKIVVIVSAIGKTTNALERTVENVWHTNKNDFLNERTNIETLHSQIVNELFTTAQSQAIFQKLNTLMDEIQYEDCLSPATKKFNHRYEYARFSDQIVSLGELMSTRIVEAYLYRQNIASCWTDASQLIATDDVFGEANVVWESTEKCVRNEIAKRFQDHDVIVTQGFIGGTTQNNTFYRTTLGREGSDYSASIFAHCIDAESVTIWKDVDGMFNADPKKFPRAIQLDKISYNEASELAYYGASVIHPKTLKPLQNKNIPLFIKSFMNNRSVGTQIQQSTEHDRKHPSFIIKENQVLISFRSRLFSFIVESNLSDIFNKLNAMKIKINLMQNSALSFSILVDAQKVNIEAMHEMFGTDYEVRYNEQVNLLTIRHYNRLLIDQLTENKEILLQQYTRETVRIVFN